MFISLSLETELKTGKFSTAILDIRCWENIGALDISILTYEMAWICLKQKVYDNVRRHFIFNIYMKVCEKSFK